MFDSHTINNLKADGVKDCVKWIKTRIQEAKKHLASCQEARRAHVLSYGATAYTDEVTKAEAKLEELVAIKISLEKYMKKLRHTAAEAAELDNIVI